MTISESLVASCLLLGTMAGSLQVWGGSVSVAVAEESRQELRERVEAELMASEARLRRHGEAMPESPDCGSQGQALGAALAAHPLPEGLRRKVTTRQDGLVQVEVAAEGLAEPARQRLWSPAAFGLCGAAAAPPLLPLVEEAPRPPQEGA
jgi:hypothetical protein